MNEQEWQDVGNKAKKVREELFNLHRMTTGNLPVAIVRHITNAIADLDRFRSAAEGRMLNIKDSTDMEVFYGPVRKKSFTEWIKQFRNGGDDDYDLYHIAVLVEKDDSFPTDEDLMNVYDHVKDNESRFTLEAFRNAWEDYDEYKYGKHFITVETIPNYSFTAWIEGFCGEDNRIGVLADGILRDPNFPTSNDIGEMQCYLKGDLSISRTIRHRVVRALNFAWFTYTGGVPVV